MNIQDIIKKELLERGSRFFYLSAKNKLDNVEVYFDPDVKMTIISEFEHNIIKYSVERLNKSFTKFFSTINGRLRLLEIKFPDEWLVNVTFKDVGKKKYIRVTAEGSYK